jgi:hypothetical protein
LHYTNKKLHNEHYGHTLQGLRDETGHVPRPSPWGVCIPSEGWFHSFGAVVACGDSVWFVVTVGVGCLKDTPVVVRRKNAALVLTDYVVAFEGVCAAQCMCVTLGWAGTNFLQPAPPNPEQKEKTEKKKNATAGLNSAASNIDLRTV